MNQAAKIGRNIGAAAGAVVFFIFGLLPGFHFGSYGALVALNHLLGHSLEPNILIRMVVVVGALLGMVCTASVSIVLGAVAGTLLGYMTDALTSPARPHEEASEAHTNGQ